MKFCKKYACKEYKIEKMSHSVAIYNFACMCLYVSDISRLNHASWKYQYVDVGIAEDKDEIQFI